jgi:uncharacterized membrane protein YkoI
MRTIFAPVSLCGFVLFLSSAIGDEEKIPLDKVPAAVTDAVKAKYPGAEFTGAEKEEEDGGTVYELAFNHQGQKYEAELKPDGTLIAVDRKIQVSDLPPAVAGTLKKRFPRATLKDAEEVTKGDTLSYEVHISLPRQGRVLNAEVVLDPNGKVLDFENPETRVALSKLPPKVLAAAKARFPGAKLIKAEKETEDGKLEYEIVLEHQGQRLEAEFTPEGEYLETEVSIKVEDLPKPVTEGLQAKYAGAEYRHAGKVTKKDGEIVYEVVISLSDGRRGEVVVSPEGKILEAKGLDRPANSDR